MQWRANIKYSGGCSVQWRASTVEGKHQFSGGLVQWRANISSVES